MWSRYCPLGLSYPLHKKVRSEKTAVLELSSVSSISVLDVAQDAAPPQPQVAVAARESAELLHGGDALYNLQDRNHGGTRPHSSPFCCGGRKYSIVGASHSPHQATATHPPRWAAPTRRPPILVAARNTSYCRTSRTPCPLRTALVLVLVLLPPRRPLSARRNAPGRCPRGGA